MSKEREVLLAARSLIETESEMYICDALFEVGIALGLNDQADELRRMVQAHITMPGETDPEWSLTDWVYMTYGTRMHCMPGNIEALARLAWIDKMLERCNEREALLKARDLVESRADIVFICHALADVAVGHPHLAEAARSLQRRIGAELRPYDALGSWLRAQIGGCPDGLRHLARLAWIDKMLEGYP